MSRYFTATTTTLNTIRLAAMDMLDQPNGRGEEPWNADGDFNVDGQGYIAISDALITGEFAPIMTLLTDNPDVVEISAAEYRAAMPHYEVDV